MRLNWKVLYLRFVTMTDKQNPPSLFSRIDVDLSKWIYIVIVSCALSLFTKSMVGWLCLCTEDNRRPNQPTILSFVLTWSISSYIAHALHLPGDKHWKIQIHASFVKFCFFPSLSTILYLYSYKVKWNSIFIFIHI